jgi:hypothetical protein
MSPNQQETLTSLFNSTNSNGAKGLNANSLLSQLPDFQQPKETNQFGGSQSRAGSLINSQQNDSNSIVKLSIEDYKRKLQKPSVNSMSNGASTNLGLHKPSQANDSSSVNNTTSNSNGNNGNNSSSLPSIPSYAVNLQAPQSLHELLRNFQS